MANFKLFVLGFIALFITHVFAVANRAGAPGSCSNRSFLKRRDHPVTVCCDKDCEDCFDYTCGGGGGCGDFINHWNCCHPNNTDDGGWAPVGFTNIDTSLVAAPALAAIEDAVAKPVDPREERKKVRNLFWRCCDKDCKNCARNPDCYDKFCAVNPKTIYCCELVAVGNSTHVSHINAVGSVVDFLD